MQRLPFFTAVFAALLTACGGGSGVNPSSNSGGETASYFSCPVFAGGDAYNARVTDTSLDAHSGQYIASMLSGGHRSSGMYVGMNVINLATNATPLVPVSWIAHRAPSGATRWPWASSFAISANQDRHALVFQRDTCHVYETYGTSYSGALSAYSGADWDLRRAFAPLPYDTPSSLSSGLSLFAGTIKAREIAAGFIGHALDLAPPAGAVAAHLFVRPASYTGGAPYTGTIAPYQLPWGAHLRLKASYDVSGYPPQARTILQALKDYGAYVADTGSAGAEFALYGESSDVWNASDLAALDNVPWSAFEVLSLGTVICDPGFPCP